MEKFVCQPPKNAKGIAFKLFLYCYAGHGGKISPRRLCYFTDYAILMKTFANDDRRCFALMHDEITIRSAFTQGIRHRPWVYQRNTAKLGNLRSMRMSV